MRTLGLLALGAAVTLSGCFEKPKGLQVIDPVVRLSANPKGPAAGYFTVKGGPTADRLLSVTSPLVIHIDMHESAMANGMMTMKTLDGGVEIPANGEVKFAEGGKHVMLFDINPGVKPNETIQMNFTFASGTILQAYAPVRAAGS